MMSENTLNHDDLRDALVRDGYVFSSDTEVIVHLIHQLSPHYAVCVRPFTQ
jgi:glucosamine 6-phosphate synthetase-like amidotransferase/phosphosugar isomerase protein